MALVLAMIHGHAALSAGAVGSEENEVILVDDRSEITVNSEQSPVMLPCPRTDFRQVGASWDDGTVAFEIRLDDLAFPCGPSPTFQIYQYVIAFKNEFWDEVEFSVSLRAELDVVSVRTAVGTLVKYDSMGNIELAAWVYPQVALDAAGSTIEFTVSRQLVELPYEEFWLWSAASYCAPVRCYHATPVIGDRVPNEGSVLIG